MTDGWTDDLAILRPVQQYLSYFRMKKSDDDMMTGYVQWNPVLL